MNWDKEPFHDAYEHILQSDFIFARQYPIKNPRNRRHSACAIIEKTEEEAKVSFLINGEDEELKIEALKKKNWFWHDSTYTIARACKWIDNNQFGFISKDKTHFVYFDIEKGQLESNIEFRDSDF